MKARLCMLALAVAILSGCAGIHSESPEFYILQGQARMNHEDYEGAANAFAQAIRVHPNPTAYAVSVLYPNMMEAYLGLIEAKWALQDYAGVIEDLNQFIRISLSVFQSPDPSFARFYTMRGIAKAQTQDYQGAVNDYTQAIYNDSNYVDAYMGRGHIYNALGKPGDARRDFTKAMSLNPAVAQAFTTPQLTELMGRATESAHELSGHRGPEEEALELNRKAGELYQAGRYLEALPLAQKALEIREKAFGPIHPDVAASLHNLALLYQAMGDHAKAESLFRRSVEINEKIFGAEKKGEADTIAR